MGRQVERGDDRAGLGPTPGRAVRRAGEGVDSPRTYLKLDTQGYDLQAFAGAGDRVKELVGMQSEVSQVPLYDGMPHMTEQLATYEAAGFGLTGMFPVILDRPTMRVIEFDAIMVRDTAVAD